MASRSGGRNSDRTSARANAGTSNTSGSARNATAGRTSGSSSGTGGGTSAGRRTNATNSNAARRPSAPTSSGASASPAGSAATGQGGSSGQSSTSGQSSRAAQSSAAGQSNTAAQSNTAGQSTTSGSSAGASTSSPRSDQERELHTSREEQGNMRPAAARQRGNSAQQGGGQWAPIFASTSPFAMMRRMMEDMDRLFSDFGFSHPGAFASSVLNPGNWGASQTQHAIGGGSPAGQSVSPTSSRQGLQRGERQGLSPSALRSLWAPQVEVFERGNNLVIRAELPGLSREDVDVEIDDDTLIIRGERHNDVDDEQEGYYRSERSYGSFYRAIPLPDNIDASQCNASFRDGVLQVSLPKPPQQSRARKIDVK